jgi:hypothetical protein
MPTCYRYLVGSCLGLHRVASTQVQVEGQIHEKGQFGHTPSRFRFAGIPNRAARQDGARFE